MDSPGFTRARLRNSTVTCWHERWAWLIGPLPAGMLAVWLAHGSEEATWLNRLLWQAYPCLPLLLMPAAFAALAWICRNCFPGAQGSGIPQASATSKLACKTPLYHTLAERMPPAASATTPPAHTCPGQLPGAVPSLRHPTAAAIDLRQGLRGQVHGQGAQETHRIATEIALLHRCNQTLPPNSCVYSTQHQRS